MLTRSLRVSNVLQFTQRRNNSSGSFIFKALGQTPTKSSNYLEELKNSANMKRSAAKQTPNKSNNTYANQLKQRIVNQEERVSNQYGKKRDSNNYNRNNTRGNKNNEDGGSYSRKARVVKTVDPINRLNKHSYDPAKFAWTNGESDLENQYMTTKIKEVFDINPDFEIMTHHESGFRTGPLRDFIKGLSVDESFDIINVQDAGSSKVPFVKVFEKQPILKKFNDKLAEEKSKLYGRTRAKKRDSGVKFIKVSWEISEHDLHNQKRNEIQSLMKSGQKVVLLIDTREKLSRNDVAFEIPKDEESPTRAKPKIGEFEELRRNKIYQYLQELFGDSSVEVTGNLAGRMLITVKPEVKKHQEEKEKKEVTDKKLERKLKQQKREEEKRLKLEAKRKEMEEILAKNNIT